VTLQAYAECEERRGETEAAGHLRASATERFAALGMSRMRQTWADVYAGGPPVALTPQDDEDRQNA
jgi:hypothetical protein